MDKSDLKNGMLITFRNESNGVVVGDKIAIINKDGTSKGAVKLSLYRNNLKRLSEGNSNLDVMLVKSNNGVIFSRKEKCNCPNCVGGEDVIPLPIKFKNGHELHTKMELIMIIAEM